VVTLNDPFLAQFDMFLTYELQLAIFACVYSAKKLFSSLILGSVFSDYVVFYGIYIL